MNYIDDIDEFDVDDLDVLDFLEWGIPRQTYTRASYFDTMDASTFRKRFRLSKATVLNVLAQIEHQLEYPYEINNCVTPIDQLLACLRLYSTGGHLDTVADFSGMHVSTVSRIVSRVSTAIARLARNHINFPSTADAVRTIQQQFFDVAAFPKVIGTIDCTHFKIISPGEQDPEIFRNRKGYFSINSQFICDAQLRILNVVARWPGSTHDSTIFNNSRIKGNFENNMYAGSILLGDSGYANNAYLITPLLNPRTPGEQLYNESHIRTRNTVERLFGVLKRRFPILAYGCRLKLDTFLTIIVATSVLHNLALTMGNDEVPPLPEELDQHILNEMIINGQIPNIDNNVQGGAGAASRMQLINNYFNERV